MLDTIHMMISFYMSLFAFGLIARWYIFPRIRSLALTAAALPLVLLHCFRHMGLVYLIPAVVVRAPPPEFSLPTAYGDLASAGLAFVAALALRGAWPWHRAALWAFNIVGTLDLLIASVQAARVEMMSYSIGAAYFLPIVVVPALLVSHIMIFMLLMRREGAADGGAGAAAGG